MTREEAIAAIEARLAEKPFAKLDDILGEGWALGKSFRGHPPTYRSAALDRAREVFGDG